VKTTPKDPLSKALEELDATSQDFNKKMQESKTKLQKRIKELTEIPNDQLPYKQPIEEPSFKENATSQDFNKKMKEAKANLQERINKLNAIPDDQLPYKQEKQESSFEQDAKSLNDKFTELTARLQKGNKCTPVQVLETFCASVKFSSNFNDIPADVKSAAERIANPALVAGEASQEEKAIEAKIRDEATKAAQKLNTPLEKTATKPNFAVKTRQAMSNLFKAWGITSLAESWKKAAEAKQKAAEAKQKAAQEAYVESVSTEVISVIKTLKEQMGVAKNHKGANWPSKSASSKVQR
jgi:KaiC/GvpD/RAD55 family RecA-like ATPase